MSKIKRKPSRRYNPNNNPVLAAFRRQAVNEWQTNTAIAVLMADDGSHQPEAIGDMVQMILNAASAAAYLSGVQDKLRRFHAAARTLLTMAEDGCRWDASHAERMDASHAERMDAVHWEAYQFCLDHPEMAARFFDDAARIGRLVKQGKARVDMIAGAELYKRETAA